MPDQHAPLRSALKRIDAWFAKHRPRFHKALHPGADPATLADLPEELRVLLSWHNGQSGDFAGCFEEHWFLMSAEEICEADMDTKGWYAFLDDDAGNYLCLDTTKSPAPVVGYYLDDTPPDPVAPSLSAWMTAFADDLEAGKYTEDTERGTLIRKHSSK